MRHAREPQSLGKLGSMLFMYVCVCVCTPLSVPTGEAAGLGHGVSQKLAVAPHPPFPHVGHPHGQWQTRKGGGREAACDRESREREGRWRNASMSSPWLPDDPRGLPAPPSLYGSIEMLSVENRSWINTASGMDEHFPCVVHSKNNNNFFPLLPSHSDTYCTLLPATYPCV